MEKLIGYSIANTERLHEEEIDTKELAERGANMYLEIIFHDRSYHADAHPGNIWILSGGVIGLLDCGMIGRLDERLKPYHE